MELKHIIILTIVIWLSLIIPTSIVLRIVLSPKPTIVPPLENGVRLAFFADLHIMDENMGAETDFMVVAAMKYLETVLTL